MLFGMDTGTIGGVLVMDAFEKSVVFVDLKIRYSQPTESSVLRA
jgi:hypothetical protein